jgi:glycopeptide antibiotics resistance protein
MSVFRYVPMDGLFAGFGVACVIVAILVSPSLIHRKWTQAAHNAARIMLAASLLAIASLTLIGGPDSGGMNLVPGRGIAGSLGNLNRALGVANVLGNVALFMPTGALLPVALGLRWRTCVFASSTLSLGIEACQFTIGRFVDVDDVVLNSLGGAFGAALGIALTGAFSRRTNPRPGRPQPATH